MTARERVMTARLMEKLQQNPAYARHLGLSLNHTEKKPPKETKDKSS